MTKLQDYTPLLATHWLNGSSGCATKRARIFRKRSQPSAKIWRPTVATKSPARAAVQRSSAFATRLTKQTTVQHARPAANCSPIEHCRDCCEKTGQRLWKNLGESFLTAHLTHNR